MVEEDSNKLMWAAGAIVVAIVLIAAAQILFPKLFAAVGDKVTGMINSQKVPDAPATK